GLTAKATIEEPQYYWSADHAHAKNRVVLIGQKSNVPKPTDRIRLRDRTRQRRIPNYRWHYRIEQIGRNTDDMIALIYLVGRYVAYRGECRLAVYSDGPNKISREQESAGYTDGRKFLPLLRPLPKKPQNIMSGDDDYIGRRGIMDQRARREGRKSSHH